MKTRVIKNKYWYPEAEKLRAQWENNTEDNDKPNKVSSLTYCRKRDVIKNNYNIDHGIFSQVQQQPVDIKARYLHGIVDINMYKK